MRNVLSTMQSSCLRTRSPRVTSLTLLCLLCLSLSISAQLPEAPEAFRVLSYNTYNFMAADNKQLKSPESRRAVIQMIAATDADVAFLTEVGGRDALAEITQLLTEEGCVYPYQTVVEGPDWTRRIGVLARTSPAEVRHNVSASYNLRGERVSVLRGFAHCVFKWRNGYALHLLAAHLKSKVYHPLGQTDMRRYEARQLRYVVDDILDAEPEANILVVGDMNDTPDSSPISTLCNRRRKKQHQLYDLRPVDRYGMAWTHLWDTADIYTRIDYAFVSFWALPEVDFERTLIPFIPDWYLASDHRPVVVTVGPGEQPEDSGTLGRFHRNVRQPDPPVSFFNQGKVVGTRKARR